MAHMKGSMAYGSQYLGVYAPSSVLCAVGQPRVRAQFQGSKCDMYTHTCTIYIYIYILCAHVLQVQTYLYM